MTGAYRLALAITLTTGSAALLAAPAALAREVEQAAAAEPSVRELCLDLLDEPARDAKRQSVACTALLGGPDVAPAEVAGAHLARALAASRLGKPSARDDYRRSIELFTALIDPLEPNALYLYRRATAYHALGEAKPALADYNAAIQRSPRRSAAFLNRGLLLAHYTGEMRSALVDFDEAARIDPANAFAVMLRGEAHSMLGEYPAALADFDRASAMARDTAPGSVLAPILAQIQVLRGLANARKGDAEAARADYDKALALDGDNADALLNRAALDAQAGRNDQAILGLDRLLKRQPTNAVALYNRGYSRFASGDYQGAATDYGAALSNQPDMAMAYNNRCLARAVVGRDPEGARADCREALARLPQQPDVHETAAFLHLKLDEPARAIEQYDRALEIAADRPLALWGRGTAKLRLGDTAGGEADRQAARARFAEVEREFTKYGVR